MANKHMETCSTSLVIKNKLNENYNDNQMSLYTH